MVYRGVVRKGQVRVEGNVDLPDGTAVSIRPVKSSPKAAARSTSLGKLLRRVAGALDGEARPGVTDLAYNHDHYLYGTPKLRPAVRRPGIGKRPRRTGGGE